MTNSTQLHAGRHAPERIAVAVACLLGAQFLHWRVIDQHAHEWMASGVFFFVLALVEGCLAILLVTQRRPSVVVATVAASAVPVMIWAWDRTLGLPFGPTKGIRDTIGRSDAMSVVFEILTVLALWPMLRALRETKKSAAIEGVGRAVIAITCAYVAASSVWATLGDQNAVHHVTATTVTVVGLPSPAPANGVPLNAGIASVPARTSP